MTLAEAVDLTERLRGATTVSAACAVVVDALVAEGYALPSLYLERGGLLRCEAVRGYWQVFDGVPAGAGVIGQVFRTGAAVHLRVSEHQLSYLAAAPEVVDEVCVPIFAGSRVIGVLNVEATVDLPDDTVERLTVMAGAFAIRLAGLGGPPSESVAQRLARHATVLTGLDRRADLHHAILRAAQDLCGLESAVLLLPTRRGGLRVVASAGVIGQRLAAIAPAELDGLAGWIEAGTSCWTHGDVHGALAGGQQAMRAAGVASMALVPVTTATGTGALLVAEPRRWRFATESVELLELLGTYVGACLRSVDTLDLLREQAACDPLTGLGHHGAHRQALESAIAAQDPSRRVAVAMLDLDGFKRVNDRGGHPAGDQLLCDAATALSSTLREGDRLYRVGGDEFATILGVTDETEALTLVARLNAAARSELDGITVSIGVAFAEPGETSEEVIARADLALYEVKRAGRDGAALAPPPTQSSGSVTLGIG